MRSDRLPPSCESASGTCHLARGISVASHLPFGEWQSWVGLHLHTARSSAGSLYSAEAEHMWLTMRRWHPVRLTDASVGKMTSVGARGSVDCGSLGSKMGWICTRKRARSALVGVLRLVLGRKLGCVFGVDGALKPEYGD